MSSTPRSLPAAASELVAAVGGGGVLEAIRAAAILRRRPLRGAELPLLLELISHGDVLARASAAYALSRSPGPRVDRVLTSLLRADEPTVREAAALALGGRGRPSTEAALVETAAAGGFGGMLAELALEDPLPMAPPPRPAPRSQPGLRVAQVVLQGRIDGALQDTGAGDGGGLATLVVHLSRALGRRPEIAHAATITRAFHDPHARASHHLLREPLGEGAAIERIAFGPPGYLAASEMWRHRRELERALEQALRRLLPLDVVHLRFADVGTLAAARACRRLGIPVCFTLAADPHVVLRAAERAGTLDRETFPEANDREHYLFRAHVVESLLEAAEGLVVFPRADAAADLRDLLGIAPSAVGGRPLRPISEGVSLRTLDRGARTAGRGEPEVARDLRLASETLPRGRAALPLLLSVGRFHRVKGFHRLLEAWAGDPRLFASFNLALVGGNLERPTGEEQAVLRSLRAVTERLPQARDGLLLLGHRSHDEVAALLHLARAGPPGIAAPGAVYACASDKEEFGLALLEALGAGLVVVAPAGAGPDTFVDHGSTGFLVDTTSVEELRAGLHTAAAIREDDARAARAAALVRSRFSIDGMAEELTSLYLDLAAPRVLEAAA